VIVWAAGNGAESVDRDGYASYGRVLAIAACNDHGRRSRYSDHGKAVFCAFPSNDVKDADPLTPGITTTDRLGNLGYNPDTDLRDGDTEPSDRDYTNSFGGTSAAAPGVAGIVALVLSVNPDLCWADVRDILRRSCDKIDRKDAAYDATGHSKKLGYGRINARKAVERALKVRGASPAPPRRVGG
jgi:subtilisin family serine protease